MTVFTAPSPGWGGQGGQGGEGRPGGEGQERLTTVLVTSVRLVVGLVGGVVIWCVGRAWCYAVGLVSATWTPLAGCHLCFAAKKGVGG